MFAFTQALDRLLVERVHEQLEATYPFKCENVSMANTFGRFQQRVVASGKDDSHAVPQFQLRTTLRAGIRLGMETAVARIVKFLVALRTHRELAHGCVRAIIRQVFDDGETRTAMRAVCKWIQVAT